MTAFSDVSVIFEEEEEADIEVETDDFCITPAPSILPLSPRRTVIPKHMQPRGDAPTAMSMVSVDWD